MKRIIYFLIVISAIGCYSNEHQLTGLEGKEMPSFKLLLADSITDFNTKDIPTGKETVLFYFGPHCPYSHAQMVEIIEDIDMLKNINFYVFTNWKYADMKMFYNRHNLHKYPNITVGIDYNNSFSNIFEAMEVPYLAVYNKNKKLNEVFIGKIYSKQIKNAATK